MTFNEKAFSPTDRQKQLPTEAINLLWFFHAITYTWGTSLCFLTYTTFNFTTLRHLITDFI